MAKSKKMLSALKMGAPHPNVGAKKLRASSGGLQTDG